MSDTILTDKTLKWESQEDDENENENVNENVNENEYVNENVNENDKTLISSDKDDDADDDDDDDDENENEIINQNNSNKIKELNDHLDEIIDKSKSFEEQIKFLEKREDLTGYWPYDDFGDKELKSKYFKINLADILKINGKKLFQQIFVHTLEALANKLRNTTSKEENQIIVSNIDKNNDKLYKECETSYGRDYVLQPSDRRIDLKDAIDLILDFNETTQLDLIWKYKN